MEISQNFVAFSEYMNFKLKELSLKYNSNQIQILPVGIGTYSNRPIAGPYCEIGL